MARADAAVFVVGSLHWDVIVNAPALPRADETVIGDGVAYAFGGKGGNQALAAVRMGAGVAMAGRVGRDDFGDRIMAVLAGSGVDHEQVLRDDGASGMSVAIVEAGGDYGAVVVSGANRRIDAEKVTIPETTGWLLLQNEIPAPVNRALARRARAMGARVIWNAAPAGNPDPDMMRLSDILVVNRVEAADLTGLRDATEQARALRRAGPQQVVVTLGAQGLILAGESLSPRPAFAVETRSTHGAGDMFAGALAARLASGAAMVAALEFAQAAAALHVSLPPDKRAAITAEQVASFQTASR